MENLTPLTFTPNDWDTLNRIRQRFLDPPAQGLADYWSSDRELLLYDLTFAERIAWKWNAVLAELVSTLGFRPDPTMSLVDWGCGTGVATRRVLAAFPDWTPPSVHLQDRSNRAVNWASERICSLRPGLNVEGSRLSRLPPNSLLLVSHVWDELPPRESLLLQDAMRQARLVIWVEPGTPKVAAGMVAVRDTLLGHPSAPMPKSSSGWSVEAKRVWAPCPHQHPCGMALRKGNDWCHFFAPAPSEAFQQPFWSEFSRKLGIDLRALPVSYLVLGDVPPPCHGTSVAPEVGNHRVVGRPRSFKGYLTCQICSAEGAVLDERVIRSKNKVLHDRVKDGGFRVEFP